MNKLTDYENNEQKVTTGKMASECKVLMLIDVLKSIAMLFYYAILLYAMQYCIPISIRDKTTYIWVSYAKMLPFSDSQK